jgi:hypothetical protein
MPVVGVLGGSWPTATIVPPFRQGLKEAGYVEARTSPSNLDLPKANTIGCRRWPLSC